MCQDHYASNYCFPVAIISLNSYLVNIISFCPRIHQVYWFPFYFSVRLSPISTYTQPSLSCCILPNFSPLFYMKLTLFSRFPIFMRCTFNPVAFLPLMPTFSTVQPYWVDYNSTIQLRYRYTIFGGFFLVVVRIPI